MQFAQCCEEHRCRPKCDQVSRGEQGESGRGRGEKWEGYGFDLYALVRSRVGERPILMKQKLLIVSIFRSGFDSR